VFRRVDAAVRPSASHSVPARRRPKQELAAPDQREIRAFGLDHLVVPILAEIFAQVAPTGLSAEDAIMCPVSDLETDMRTAYAFSESTARTRVDPTLGRLDPKGAPVEVLSRSLGAGERVLWLGWSMEVRSEQPLQWWVVALTEVRLLGVATGPHSGSPIWQVASRQWHGTRDGDDVVLTLSGGPPLRVRGAGDAAGAALFGCVPAPVELASDLLVDSATGAPALPIPEVGDIAVDVVADPRVESLVASWQEAEALAAWHMRELGFDDAPQASRSRRSSTIRSPR